MNQILRFIQSYLAQPELIVVVFMMAVAAALVVPLPPLLLDFFLVCNLGISVSFLIIALHIKSPLGLSTFPSIILAATLFRLALNVSSTRLILGSGEAGSVIRSFGEFVIGGSYAVGAVVFIIILVVQFLVVAKGAERVAEVGARFTLDALPGKQMAIDGDIRSGACTTEEACIRRTELETESRFYGALDGAMKFVKGDAIAGLLIAVINIIGGFTVGMAVHGLPAGEAAAVYTLLSIGDGLVSQLPALFTAVAAGMVVTRVNSGERLGGEMVSEIIAQPKAIFISGLLFTVMGFMPGLPALPFMFFGICAAGGAFWRMQKEKGESEGSDTHERLDGKIKSGKSSEAKGSGSRRGEDSLNMDDAMSSPVLLAVDQGVSEEIFEALAKKLIPGLVERIAGKLGLPLPELPVLRTSRPGNSFEVIINELPAFRGIVPSKPALINAFSDNSVLQGEDRGLLLNDNEPSSELKNSSIIEQGEILKDGALMNADISESALISPEEHVAGIVEKLIEERASELLSLETVSNLLDLLEKRSPSLVREAGKHISVTLLWEVLVRLLEERVSIRALDRILEALAKVAESGAVNDVTSLCEYARQSIGRHIVYSASRGEHLNAVLLDPLLESILRESSTRASGEQILAIMPEHRKNLYDAMQRELKGGAVLLAPVDLRRALWSLARGSVPDAAVISYQELPQDIRIQPVARLAIEMPDINNKAGAPLDC